MIRSNFDNGETCDLPAYHDALPPAMPAAREWSSGLFGLAGLACLAGCGVLVAERLGLVRGIEVVGRATDALATVGATPALMAVGGAVLVGLAAGARGRRRQTQRIMDALGQMPDHGAWLEDLDASLQRLHVSLVTVESRLSSAIEHTANTLEERLSQPRGDNSHEIQELGARVMRIGSTVDHLSAGVARIEERTQRPPQDSRMGELLERVARLTARVEGLKREPIVAPAAQTSAREVQATAEAETILIHVLDTPDEVRSMPSVDEPAAAMPRPEAVEIDVDTESAVAGLPLFAGVEEPQRSQNASQRARRNPYNL